MPSKKATDGKWYSRFYYTDWAGKRIRKKKEGFLTKRDADKYEVEFLATTKVGTRMTFAQLYILYMEHSKINIKLTSFIGKKGSMDVKILPYFKNMQITQIEPNDVRLWQNQIISKNPEYKPTYLKTINNNLSAIFNFAMKYYNLQRNPARLCGSMGCKKPIDEMSFWTEEEFKSFLPQIENKEISRILFNVLFYTGMRVGEVLALTLNDINFDEKYINVNKSYTRLERKDIIQEPKTPKSRRKIFVPCFLCNLLKDYSDRLYDYLPSERLFPVTKFYLLREIQRGVKGTDLKRIRTHDLRHSHASHLIELGTSIYVISERLGHENINTTLETYSHLYPNKQEEVAQKLQDIYDNQS